MTFIFLGPSLNLEEAKQTLDAYYLPPAEQGDILSLVKEKKPKIIGLIDGYFSQALSVWHKEILYALQEGVTVLGASSMGALRAAETDRFGMIGIGKIYEMYKNNELTDDDEVALVHGPRESGYLSFSIPMVNIRMTLQNAVKKGHAAKDICKKWIDTAKSLHYPERTVEQINAICELSEEEKCIINQIFSSDYIDQKKWDALMLLECISENKIPKSRIFNEPFNKEGNFQHLYHLDRSVEFAEGKITLEEIAKYVALHHPNFSQLRRQALNRWLVNVLVEIFEIQVAPEEVEIEKERFKVQNEISYLHTFEEWLKNNHLSEQEYDQLMMERAKAQKLYLSPLAGSSKFNLYRAVLDELRLSDKYSEWVIKAFMQKTALKNRDFFYLEKGKEEEQAQEIFCEQVQKTEWDLDVSLKQWCEEAGFNHLQEVVLELHRTFLARKNSQHLEKEDEKKL